RRCAAAGQKCSTNASVTAFPESEQHAGALERHAVGRSTNIPKKCRALDPDGTGRAKIDARAGQNLPRTSQARDGCRDSRFGVAPRGRKTRTIRTALPARTPPDRARDPSRNRSEEAAGITAVAGA